MTRTTPTKSLLLAAVLLLGLTSVAPAAAVATADPAAAAGDAFELSIRFDREPVERGLTFDRARDAKPVEVDAGKGKEWAWRAAQGSAPKMPWARSVYVTVTDPRFRGDAQPAVDVEVTYRINAQVPVLVWMDTADGPREVAVGFGQTGGWRTIRGRADNAFFAARTHANPADLAPQGCDIRVTGFNADLEVKSIKVRGYDLTEAPDYGRLLRVEKIETQTPDGLLLFNPGQRQPLAYHFRNIAHKPLDAAYALTVTDRAGRQVASAGGQAEFGGRARSAIEHAVDTGGLAHGVYSLTLAVRDRATGRPVLERESYFGVASAAELPKARGGEFLYGLDVMLGSPANRPRLLRWANVMGVDILRGGGNTDQPDDVDRTLAAFDRAGLRAMLMADPPKDADAGRRRAQLPAKLRAVEEVARRTRGKVTYWELGNEPDLTFFYPGPMADYVDAFHQMRDAVKRGNPDAVVMNGGLSFAGADGAKRSREFMELVDVGRIDAFAYHAHGPGAAAERDALNRIRDIARRLGKDVRPYVDTESGVAARTRSQEDVQARTVVQKMVFAQAERMPLFMWFRLFMFEEDYGSLHDRDAQGPRPAVLAYRAMVEALRHHAFSHSLPVDKPGAQAHVFHEARGGARRAAVLWVERPAGYNVYLKLAASAEQARDVTVRDLYGNAAPATVLPGGSVAVAVGEAPVYVTWTAADPAFAAALAPPLLDPPAAAELVADAENRVPVTVRNPLDRPLELTLAAATADGMAATVAPATQTVALAAGEARTVDVTVTAARGARATRWAAAWTVFTDARDDGVDLATLDAVPPTLPGRDGGTARPRTVKRAGDTIDFARLGAAAVERRAAFAFAEVTSDADRTVIVGASADWWMTWYLNGQKVYDTSARGNGGGFAVTDHTFPVTLRKGRNLLACRVLSGSMGFKLLFADPASLARVLDPLGRADRIELALSAGGTQLVADRLNVVYTEPVAAAAGLALTDDLAEWEASEPDVLLDAANVLNFHVAEPDAERWWKGDADLSAHAWLRSDAAALYLVVKAYDDRHVTAGDLAGMWEQDSLQVAFSPSGRAGEFDEYTVGQSDGRATVFKQHAAAGGSPAGVLLGDDGPVRATIERVDTPPGGGPAYTVYRVAVDRAALGPKSFWLNVAVNDNDAGYRKQAAQWKPGLVEAKDPSRWGRGAWSD